MGNVKFYNEFINEGKSSKCMSESMYKKMDEMYEAMCSEMKACHEDSTSHTAENYASECSEKLNEMMEKMIKESRNYMKM
jgi:hypothetical protein